MKAALALARTLHGGTNVYKSRRDSLAVLHAVEATQPSWWSPACTDFVRQTESLGPVHTSSAAASMREPNTSATTETATAAAGVHRRAHPVILVEGLDGTGKTLITRALAAKLPGIAVVTPSPHFSAIREAFRHQDEAIARAFYSAANYLSAEDILQAALSQPVVVDRWWCSTCAMALAHVYSNSSMPPAGNDVYRWPSDLLRPDIGFLLEVEEAVRLQRIRRRAPEDAEERRLSAQAEMRRVAMAAYARTEVLTVVPAPSYRAAVNTMLEELSKRGIPHEAVPFTAEELHSIAPY